MIVDAYLNKPFGCCALILRLNEFAGICKLVCSVLPVLTDFPIRKFVKYRYKLFLSLMPAFVSAQLKDTVHLNEINISTPKYEHFSQARKIQKSDSLLKSFYDNGSLSDYIAFNTPVFVRNYGPSNLSTSSFRGGNAQQTAVLWNGFNIQNPMLGQNDFSQIPNFIFDEVDVEYGGASALWGSGAIGGSIRLNTKPGFNKGLQTVLNIGAGNFETKKINSSIHYSNNRFSTTTKLYYNRSENNFIYSDITKKRQIHADYAIKGFLQQLSFLPVKNQKITIQVWYNRSLRNLPPATGNNISKASQYDDNTKFSADWNYYGKRTLLEFKAGYFNDVLNYTDSIAGLFSNNRTKTFITESNIYYRLNDNQKIYAGINFTNFKALTNNYVVENPGLSKQAFLLGYSLYLLNKKMSFDCSMRQEFSDMFTIPFTGSAGLTYEVVKQLKLKLNAAKLYRHPTLNDLFWKNGGNPDLKPEYGYSFDGGAEYKMKFRKLILQSECTYFNKHINDWINWLPGTGGYPSPVNVLKVYSRGTETSNSIVYLKKDFLFKLFAHTAYVLSTPLKSVSPNDAAIGRQLIYTPRYNYGAGFSLVFHDFSMLCNYNYTGYRFTSSDNSSWLNPYHLTNVKFSYLLKYKTSDISSAFHINNLFNTNYRVIAGSPMPLRYYEISLTIRYKQPKTKQL